MNTKSKVSEVIHAESLALIGYIYSSNGYDVVFPAEISDQKTSDLIINGMTTELKITNPEVLQKKTEYIKLGYDKKNTKGYVDTQRTFLSILLERIEN